MILWIYALSVSLPSCPSVELAFDQPWITLKLGQNWGMGRRVGGWDCFALGERGLLGWEVKTGWGSERVWERRLLKELAYSWGSLSTLEMGGKPTPDRGKGEVSKAAGGELKEYQIFACLLIAPAGLLACMPHKLFFAFLSGVLSFCVVRCVTQDP